MEDDWHWLALEPKEVEQVLIYLQKLCTTLSSRSYLGRISYSKTGCGQQGTGGRLVWWMIILQVHTRVTPDGYTWYNGFSSQ